MTEKEHALMKKVEELDAKRDVAGLLDALKSARELNPPYHGIYTTCILVALGHVEAPALDRPDVISTMQTQAKAGYSEAVKVLAKVGSDAAFRAILSVAQNRDVFWSTRAAAFSCLGSLGGDDAVTLILETLCNIKEGREVRLAASDAFWHRATLSEIQYRKLLSWAGENSDDPAALSVFTHAGDKRDNTAATPLLEALNQLQVRLDALEKDKTQAKSIEAALLCYRTGLSSLMMLVRPVANSRGFQFGFQQPLVVSKDGKPVISYDRQQAVTDPIERKRVLDFWTKWWQENKTADIPPPVAKKAEESGNKDAINGEKP
jgi:hypothetical protein